MGIPLAGFVTMIVVTLLYSSELEGSTVLKYWGVFLLIVLFNRFVFYIPFISPLLQFGVAIALYAKARFRFSLE